MLTICFRFRIFLNKRADFWQFRFLCGPFMSGPMTVSSGKNHQNETCTEVQENEKGSRSQPGGTGRQV